jgi:hypothetical protein
VPEPESRFLSFILTTDALRPDFVNSAFWTTIGSFPTMITLPARISWAIFIVAPGSVSAYVGWFAAAGDKGIAAAAAKSLEL